MIKKISLLSTSLLLAACGSMKTVTKSNFEIGYDLYKNDTKCTSTTRIYSGVTYDFCRFHAENTGSSNNVLVSAFYVFDIAFFSPIADTALLPLTIYQQVSYGNPDVHVPR